MAAIWRTVTEYAADFLGMENTTRMRIPATNASISDTARGSSPRSQRASSALESSYESTLDTTTRQDEEWRLSGTGRRRGAVAAVTTTAVPARPISNPRKILVLDLDETLIRRMWEWVRERENST